MACKNTWITKIPSTQESIQISSWTSSESEEDEESRQNKTTKYFKRAKVEEVLQDPFSLPENHENQIVHAESPILSRLNEESMSPVLTQFNYKEMSPTIGKGSILLATTVKFQKAVSIRKNITSMLSLNKDNTEVKESVRSTSPDLFASQEELVIENYSPTKATKTIQTAISQSQTDTQPENHYKIEPASTQDSSYIPIETEETNNTLTATNTNSNIGYYQPKPNRKRYRKGTLAYQLRKALEKQKSSVAIWEHEVFLNKLSQVSLISDKNPIECKILNVTKEYGCFLFECSEINTLEVFIVIPGFNILATSYKEDSIITFYPPFQEKVIEHKSKNVKCYFNVSKILCPEVR